MVPNKNIISKQCNFIDVHPCCLVISELERNWVESQISLIDESLPKSLGDAVN